MGFGGILLYWLGGMHFCVLSNTSICFSGNTSVIWGEHAFWGEYLILMGTICVLGGHLCI